MKAFRRRSALDKRWALGPHSRSEGYGWFSIWSATAGNQFGRIYAGPGSAPLIAAATAWDALASELQTTAASYASTIGELTTSWRGPPRQRASAAAPYTAWLSDTATQAEQTASQAQAAAAAYEAAFAASIPPPVIDANGRCWPRWSQPTSWASTPRRSLPPRLLTQNSGLKMRVRCTHTQGRRPPRVS